MNENPKEPIPAFQGLRPPHAPESMRRGVLARAVAAMERERDLWIRVWESPVARVAWAACVILLVAGHVVVSVRDRAVEAKSAVAARPEDSEDDLTDIARLPRTRGAALARLNEYEERFLPSDVRGRPTPTSANDDEEKL